VTLRPPRLLLLAAGRSCAGAAGAGAQLLPDPADPDDLAVCGGVAPTTCSRARWAKLADHLGGSVVIENRTGLRAAGHCRLAG
jgi:hypothetical protein